MFGDCIREFGDGYLVMSGTAVPTGTVKLYSSALKETATLTASSHTNYDHLSATDTAIVTVEGGNHQLAVYNAATLKLEYIIKLVDYKKPRGVFIYNKDSVLVSDNDGNKISLYELKKDGKLLWTCDGLESPTGISVDDDGLIYVACNNKLVIISRKGSKCISCFLATRMQHGNWLYRSSMLAHFDLYMSNHKQGVSLDSEICTLESKWQPTIFPALP